MRNLDKYKGVIPAFMPVMTKTETSVRRLFRH